MYMKVWKTYKTQEIERYSKLMGRNVVRQMRLFILRTNNGCSAGDCVRA